MMKEGVKNFGFVVKLKITAQLISCSLLSLHILRSLGRCSGGGWGWGGEGGGGRGAGRRVVS